MKAMATDWRVWQLADSAFPVGAMAHSSGLEAAVQHHVVIDGQTLREFVGAMLRQLHCGVSVFVDRAWCEPDEFAAQDADCDLFLNSSVANRASRAQGQAFLATAANTFRQSELDARLRSIRRQQSPGHLAPIFGWVGRLLDLDRAQSMQLFCFTNVRGCLSSAVRLGVIGPLEAQRILATLSADTLTPSPGTPGEGGGEGEFERRTTFESGNHPHPNPLPVYRKRGPAQISPMIDLFQSTQDRLYSRLFQS